MGMESLTCGRDNRLGLANIEHCNSSNRKLRVVECTGAKHFCERVNQKISCGEGGTRCWKKKNSRRICTGNPAITRLYAITCNLSCQWDSDCTEILGLLSDAHALRH